MSQSQYRIQFTRYSKDTCIREDSGLYFHRAETFARAYEYASTLLRGFVDADPDREYALIDIHAEGCRPNITHDVGWWSPTPEEEGE